MLLKCCVQLEVKSFARKNLLSKFQLNDATVADEIIDVLGTKSIDSLAALVVNSPAFRGFKTSKMFHHFERHLKRQVGNSTIDFLLARVS